MGDDQFGRFCIVEVEFQVYPLTFVVVLRTLRMDGNVIHSEESSVVESLSVGWHGSQTILAQSYPASVADVSSHIPLMNS